METNCVRSPWVVRVQLDPSKFIRRSVLDMTLIQARLESQKLAPKIADKVEVTCSLINTQRDLAVRFQFMTPNEISIETIRRCVEEGLLEMVVSGNTNVGRLYLREVKDELVSDGRVGG